MKIDTAESFIKEYKNGRFQIIGPRKRYPKNFELAKKPWWIWQEKLQEEMQPLLENFLDLTSQITKVAGILWKSNEKFMIKSIAISYRR